MTALIPPHPQDKKADFWRHFWRELRTLKFITRFFTWLFLLASRLAEPLMSISAIYIIIEAGIPGASIPIVHNLAVGVMIAAPEIILPGAFILAGQASAQQDKKAIILHAVCWLFVVLTAITLMDLFIWHWQGVPLQLLMWGRCVVGIGYSILLRVLTHKDEDEEDEEQQSPPTPIIDYQELARNIAPHLPPPSAPTLDYQQIACILAPMLAKMVQEQVTTTATHEIADSKQDSKTVRQDESIICQDADNVSGKQKSQEDVTASDSGQKGPRTADTQSGQDTFNRLQIYIEQHSPTTQKEVAATLGISERTVRRHLTAMKKSGQLPASWRDADGGQDNDDDADSGQRLRVVK
jgi:hypothetical protein